MKKPRKKKQELKGMLQSGLLFIGDAGYMADGHHHSAEGIATDPLNPFKDLDRFLAQNPSDANLELHGSYNGDLPGRGIAIHTNLLSGSYTVTKKLDKVTGKLLELKIKFKE